MWYFSKVPFHLPKARGNHVPGVMDVMLDYSKTGLFMRMYYPTDKKITIESNYEKWVPSLPDYGYIKGIANVVMIPSFVIYLAWLHSGKLKIPALYGEKIKNEGKLKCIIFSHGLGAYRSLYSIIALELASRGYLVAVLEHRDESACYTYYYDSKEDAQKDKRTSIPFKSVPVGQGHFDVRKEQVTNRSNEMSRAIDFFKNLQKGQVPYNVIDEVPSDKENHFKLSDLVGRLDLDNIMLGGHSFGAATALLTLSKRTDTKLGIILDPWMFPVKDEELHLKISQPLIFINTQTFHIKSNVDALEPFLNDEDKREMYTILKTTHEVQTDTVFIAGYWLNWFMKKLDPKQGIMINNNLILKFLKEHTGHSEDIQDCEVLLEANKNNISPGLTKPWA